ncbi:MAG: hypothetical protein BGO01_20730 [Armatimonadetes bacterium 55-13]|nr:hypothetical protein [Armatimonadota bacterium]OJU64538.1 MAG: hypothetical protein BGO01_20730 [Armatimonadetes bacterium 55-13]
MRELIQMQMAERAIAKARRDRQFQISVLTITALVLGIALMFAYNLGVAKGYEVGRYDRLPFGGGIR